MNMIDTIDLRSCSLNVTIDKASVFVLDIYLSEVCTICFIAVCFIRSYCMTGKELKRERPK